VVLERKMARKKVEKRFGTIAVEKEFITVDQLMDALEVQVREDMAGLKHRLIGRILYDMGFITFPQIEEIMSSMNPDNVSKNSQNDDVGE
jgi:hypothetical protein